MSQGHPPLALHCSQAGTSGAITQVLSLQECQRAQKEPRIRWLELCWGKAPLGAPWLSSEPCGEGTGALLFLASAEPHAAPEARKGYLEQVT